VTLKASYQKFQLKAYKTHITAILTHLVLKLNKNKNIRCSFKATANAADKRKLFSIGSTVAMSERNFCDGLATFRSV